MIPRPRHPAVQALGVAAAMVVLGLAVARFGGVLIWVGRAVGGSR